MYILSQHVIIFKINIYIYNNIFVLRYVETLFPIIYFSNNMV